MAHPEKGNRWDFLSKLGSREAGIKREGIGDENKREWNGEMEQKHSMRTMKKIFWYMENSWG